MKAGSAGERDPHAAAATGGARRPHIVLVVARGEAVRNFLYSDTLPTLHRHARVTLLSVIDDERFVAEFRPATEWIVPLAAYAERRLVRYLRFLVHDAHFRWLWNETAQTVWAQRDAQTRGTIARAKRLFWKACTYALARRRILERLTELERALTWHLRPTDDFVELWQMLQPDLVLNTSHVHGAASDLPLRTAQRMGIPTAAFIFSWDNLTSRSRIFPAYDYYIVWNERMRGQLRRLYPAVPPARVLVTGTPQFDFHFRPAYAIDREELARRIGLDAGRPFVLYTTSIARHFPEEHRHVELVARLLREMDHQPHPQLVVRTYVKGTSPEMKALAAQDLPGVIFAPMRWDEKWHLPLREDLAVYEGLLRHTQMGINVGSTVSLELLMHDKPVVNIAFDPPGTTLPGYSRYTHYPRYEHYRPVVESGAVMVARSAADLREMLRAGCTDPQAGAEKRRRFIEEMFGPTLDGRSGVRIAHRLLDMAGARV